VFVNGGWAGVVLKEFMRLRRLGEASYPAAEQLRVKSSKTAVALRVRRVFEFC
jgi:hypothetical protein